MCSEVESSGFKAITSLLRQYVLSVCLPGIYFTFCTNIQGWVFCAKASLLPLQAFDHLRNTQRRKILENKILTQLQTNISKIWNCSFKQGYTSIMLMPLLSKIHSDMKVCPSSVFLPPLKSTQVLLCDETHTVGAPLSNIESAKKKRKWWNVSKTRLVTNAHCSPSLSSPSCLCWLCSCWSPQLSRVSLSCPHCPGCHQHHPIGDRKWILLSPDTGACACSLF